MGSVIVSFASKITRKLFEEGKADGYVRSIEAVAKRKLAMLHFARRLADLRAPPGNRLEALAGREKGRHSIRINDQYRLCFRFDEGEGNAYDVEITDYH